MAHVGRRSAAERAHKIRLRWAFFVGLAVAAAVPAVALPKATPSTNNFRTEAQGTLVSQCTPEAIVFESELHFVFHGVTDTGGGIHLRGHVNEHLLGVTADGDEYVGNSEGNFAIQEGSTTVETLTEHFNLIGKREDERFEDLHIKTVVHLTVNANGEVTADQVRHELVCR